MRTAGTLRRRALIPAALLALCLLAPAAAQASFGFQSAEVRFENEEGAPATQAGAHPFAMKVAFDGNSRLDPKTFKLVPDGDFKDLVLEFPPGFVVDPKAVPACSSANFLIADEERPFGHCPDSSAVGVIRAHEPGETGGDPGVVFNLVPPPGAVAKLGFHVLGVPVTLIGGIRPDSPNLAFASLQNISDSVAFGGSETILWGDPADPAHDAERGHCLTKGESCPVSIAERPFITLPRSCAGPLSTSFAADPWQDPGAWIEQPTSSPATSGCDRVGLTASISGQPTSRAATSPTGLDFALDVHDEGITSPKPGAISGADIGKAVVTLPQGMSVNPSQAEGLAVCSEEDLQRETLQAEAGDGCPNASKIGSLEVETPLLEGSILKGSLFIAKPYENLAGDSLLALYIVIKDPGLGILIKQPARVEPDPATGRLTTATEDMPQLPFSHFRLHFREGTRSPLVTPSACGAYTTTALLYPSSGNPPTTSTSTFEVISGPEKSPCPAGGLPPLHPGLLAGTANNAAGSYSPFYTRITRTDAEQEITHFSIKLPPGVVGKLAGIPFCPDAAIAAAAARTGPHGGAEELAAPSCPAASEIGHTLVGSGVGPSLTYVPGKLYLAGPYHGAPLSVVAVTSAVAGPFDLGTVVVREALRINPETAEVFVDATGSDPIPHIIKGIPVHLRDIRVYVDRPDFVLNPTSCKPTSTASTVLGSGLDFASEADDNPVTVTTRFQAADCAALGFKPRLALRLRGKTKRGGNPALRAVLRPRAGDANASRISVALPHSEFLDQGHIRTICTRVQFAAGAGNGAQCPKGSVYGRARAWTPLFDQPLEGPIFLRSSEHPLPDLVLALHGLVDIDAVGRIDSVKGGIRNTFDFVPDAPVSKVVVNFQGGKKGLLENSTNICRGKHRATVKTEGHNGRVHNFRAPLKAKCGKRGKQSSRQRRR
jgi:hypothetical protein